METISAWPILDFPARLAAFPSLTISPLFFWNVWRLNIGYDSSRCGCHSWVSTCAEGSGISCCDTLREEGRRKERPRCQGRPTELLLRECLMSLLSSARYTAKPRNANYKVPLETRAQFCALPAADPGMSPNAQRIRRRQSFSWSRVLLFFGFYMQHLLP